MVVLIVAIVSAVAFSKFSTSTFQSRFFADDVRNAIRYAQMYAVGTGCNIQVSVTATSVTLFQDNGSVTPPCNGTANFSVAVVDPNNPRGGTYTRTQPSTTQTITNITADWPIYFDGLGVAHRAATTVGNNTTPYTLTVSGTPISVIGTTGFTQ